MRELYREKESVIRVFSQDEELPGDATKKLYSPEDYLRAAEKLQFSALPMEIRLSILAELQAGNILDFSQDLVFRLIPGTGRNGGH